MHGDSDNLSALYNRFASAGVMNQWFEQEQEKARVSPSTSACSPAAFRGAGRRGDTRYLCFFDGQGHPSIYWTDPELRIGAIAYVYQGTGKGAVASLLRQWTCCFKLNHEAGLLSALQQSQ